MEATWISNKEKLMLQELSTDSRASLTRLAKVAQCSVAMASRMLDRLVKKLDIKFTIEVDFDKLGFSERHIAYIKFQKKPQEDFLVNLFKNDHIVQDVYLTKGDFDILIFAAADTPIEYMRWETDLMVNLSDYLPELRPSEFIFNTLGYMPLSGAFTDSIKKGMKFDKIDRGILKLLNENSRFGYRELGKALGVEEATVRYRVFRLIRRGVITRFTIAIQNSGGVAGVFFMRYSFDKNTISRIFPEQRKHSMAEDEQLPLINRTPMIVLMSGSYRVFGMSFGKTKEESIAAGVKWHVNLVKNNHPHEAHAIVTKPIKGLLPLRNLDAKKYYRFIWS
jgi:DNA-binding Lrp family transcriptional regulator